MKMKITLITILLICFAFSMACSINLGNESDAETASTKSKETKEKKSGKEDSEDVESEESKEVAEKKEKSERKSLLQGNEDYDPVGGTKADDYDNKTHLNQNGGRIRFKRGESSAVVNGKLQNSLGPKYIIGARAGQTLYINVTDGGEYDDVVFYITAPNGATSIEGEDGSFHTSWRGELPENGDYKIHFASIEAENTDFTFFISID